MRLKKFLATLIVIPFFFFSIIPGNIFAATEISLTETGNLVPVKTLESDVPAPELDEVIEASAAFMDDNPLSEADEPKEEVKAVESEDSESGSEVSLIDSVNFFSDNFELQSNDTYYGTAPMYWYDKVKAEQAHTISRGEGITIAVIDTGIDYNHLDLAANIYSNAGEIAGDGIDNDGNGYIDDFRGWDFVNNDNNPLDDNGHGTHVAGIAGAIEGNSRGIAGIASLAKLMAVKVLDSAGSGAINGVINGIKYAADMGAKVINMSLGIAKRFLSSSLLTSFQDAVNYALNKGAIIFAAAGNEGTDSRKTAPAGLTNTIAISATNSSNKAPYWSNTYADFAAPGADIGSTYLNNQYVYMSGTSMASPIGAGIGALLYSKYLSTYSGWSGTQIYNDIYTRLAATALDLGKRGYDANFGYGLLNAYAALTYGASGSSLSGSGSSSGSGSGNGNGFGGLSFSEAIALETGYRQALSVGNWYRLEALENKPKKKRR